MANISLPFTFAPSTQAKSAEVNGDFTEIRDKFNTYAVQTDVAKTITVAHTFGADVLFTDALFDLGKSGATRPRDGFFSRNVTVGSLLTAAGGQIAFPATQVPSADANVLDDYEEGTYTPGLTFGGAAVGMTFSVQSGRYTKIGRMVFASLRFTLLAKGSSTGIALVTGLPLISAADAAAGMSVPFWGGGITFSGVVQARVLSNTTTVQLTSLASGGGATELTETAFSDSSTVMLMVIYEATA